MKWYSFETHHPKGIGGLEYILVTEGKNIYIAELEYKNIYILHHVSEVSEKDLTHFCYLYDIESAKE